MTGNKRWCVIIAKILLDIKRSNVEYISSDIGAIMDDISVDEQVRILILPDNI